MKRLGCVVFLIIFFNAFIAGAYELSSNYYDLSDLPPPKIPEIKKVDPPNYTLEIFMISIGVTIIAAAVYLYWKEKKSPKPKIQKMNFSRNVNLVPYIQVGIYPPAAQEQKYITSFRVGMRF